METRNIEGRAHEIAEGESRKVIFIASTSTKDRHGTVVNQKNWSLDRFNANPIAGYQHNVYGDDMCNASDPDDVLGPARAWLDDDQLMVEIDFETKDLNEKADKIFRKVKNGSLRAVSVGFVEQGQGKYGEGDEARGAKNETYYFEGQELLEISVVNIPSNPDALKKSFRDSTKNAISYVSKALNNSFSLGEIGDLKVDQVIAMLNDDNKIKDFKNEIKHKKLHNEENERRIRQIEYLKVKQ